MKNSDIKSIILEYTRVIKAFKNRCDVQDGRALGYRKNQDPNGELLPANRPYSIGKGLTTTGFCVSASQSLLYDNAFQALIQSRKASAKLISIDIKEEFYGECYNGSKNTWHTAILVTDSGFNIVIDITCAQFGNKFVESFIWFFDTWQKTFRSPCCKHKIIDGNGVLLKYSTRTPIFHINESPISDDTSSEIHLAMNQEPILDKKAAEIHLAMDKYPLLSNKEISLLVDFFSEKIYEFNTKLLSGKMNKYDVEYNNAILNSLYKMDIEKTNAAYYYVMTFDNKEAAMNYLRFLEKGEFILNHYAIARKVIEQPGIDKDSLKGDDTHFVLFEFINPVESINLSTFMNDSILIPYGTKLEINDIEKQIFNGALLSDNSILSTVKNNTTHIRL